MVRNRRRKAEEKREVRKDGQCVKDERKHRR